jgi:hypothetical protein
LLLVMRCSFGYHFAFLFWVIRISFVLFDHSMFCPTFCLHVFIFLRTIPLYFVGIHSSILSFFLRLPFPVLMFIAFIHSSGPILFVGLRAASSVVIPFITIRAILSDGCGAAYLPRAVPLVVLIVLQALQLVTTCAT